MYKIRFTFATRVRAIIVVNKLTADSTRQCTGRKRKGERDAVVVTRYSYDMWETNAISMDYEDAVDTDVCGIKALDKATYMAN